MHDIVARANIDQCLEALKQPDLSAEKLSMVGKVLVAEENKLGHDIEQLEFAERRAALCRSRLKQLRRVRDRMATKSADLAPADALLVTFEGILVEVETFVRQLRRRVRESSLSHLTQQRLSNAHRGVTFWLRRVEPDVWAWEFEIDGCVKSGKTRARLGLLAERRVRMLIDRERSGEPKR